MSRPAAYEWEGRVLNDDTTKDITNFGDTQYALYPLVDDTIWREIFKGVNLHEFRDFTATHESILHAILGMPHPLCDQFNIP